MSGVGDASTLPICRGDGREIVGALLAELGLGEGMWKSWKPYPTMSWQSLYEGQYADCHEGRLWGGSPLLNDYYLGSPLGAASVNMHIRSRF